jgi:hypothetical protein
MSYTESFITVSPTGSTPLRTITGSPGRHVEVMAATDQNLNIIFPNQVNITGSINLPVIYTGSQPVTLANIGVTGSIITVTGSSISNTQPVAITGSITNFPANTGITGSVTITGSLSSGSFVNAFITNPTTGGANPVAITGSTVGPVANITGSVYQLGIWNVNDTQTTNPWIISGSDRIYGTGSATYPGINEVNVLTGSPGGTEGGLVTRNIPSGTQAVSASQTTNPWMIAGVVGITGSLVNSVSLVQPVAVQQFGNPNVNVPWQVVGPSSGSPPAGGTYPLGMVVYGQYSNGVPASFELTQQLGINYLRCLFVGSSNAIPAQDSSGRLIVDVFSGSINSSTGSVTNVTGSVQIMGSTAFGIEPIQSQDSSIGFIDQGSGFSFLSTQPVGSGFVPFNQAAGNLIVNQGVSGNQPWAISGSLSTTPPQFQAVTGSSIGISVIVQPSGSLIFPVSGSSIGLPILITGSLTSGSFVNSFITNQVPVLQGVGGSGGPITWVVGGTVGLTGSNITAITGSSSGLPVTITGSVISTGSVYQLGSPWIIAGNAGITGSASIPLGNIIFPITGSTSGLPVTITGSIIGTIGLTGSAGQPFQNIINAVTGSTIGLPVTITGSLIGTFGITGSAGQPFQNIINAVSGSSIGPSVNTLLGWTGSSIPYANTGSSIGIPLYVQPSGSLLFPFSGSQAYATSTFTLSSGSGISVSLSGVSTLRQINMYYYSSGSGFTVGVGLSGSQNNTIWARIGVTSYTTGSTIQGMFANNHCFPYIQAFVTGSAFNGSPGPVSGSLYLYASAV